MNTQSFFQEFFAKHSASQSSNERFYALYRIEGNEKEALEKAHDICIEQTIEFPEDLIPSGFIRDSVFGHIERFEKKQDGYFALISYAVESSAFEITQLLNVLFGNISLKPGIRLEDIALSPSLLKIFTGPRFGIEGIRIQTNRLACPLLATALKPMGLSAKGLSELAFQFALGGIDIIKDDHGLSNQPYAPFRERIAYCGEAIAKANKITGNKTLYAPNISAPFDEILKRAMIAKQYGAGALLISPGLVGFDAMRTIAANNNINLPIIAHPAFMGSFAINPSGISPACLFGTLCRIAGADASIYPNFGGRFSFTLNDCATIAHACTKEYFQLRPIFPMPGGGLTMNKISEMMNLLGNDVIYLIGGGLFRNSTNLAENCQKLRAIIDEKST